MSSDAAATDLLTLSLHDALPILLYRSVAELVDRARVLLADDTLRRQLAVAARERALREHTWRHRLEELRSEEHTSELQSQFHLVCRLLLEKKNVTRNRI